MHVLSDRDVGTCDADGSADEKGSLLEFQITRDTRFWEVDLGTVAGTALSIFLRRS